MTKQEIQEAWVQAIKDCGQSLIDNAEKIAGDYDTQTSVSISMLLNPGDVVEIDISTTYLPKSSTKEIVALPGPQACKIYNAKDY